MNFTVAIATDDGENLCKGHFGSAKYYLIYQVADGKAKLTEKRENSSFEGDESIRGGDPEKAESTSAKMEGVEVAVGKRFGPNITRLIKKFVCVVIRGDRVEMAIDLVIRNSDKILHQKSMGEERKHLILSKEH